MVDAHSTDGTLEIVKSFPVKLFFDEGKRPYYAREIGWRNTTGELILFMDADTRLGDGFFPEICDFFGDASVGMVTPQQKAIVTNSITRAIGEWWLYQTSRLRGLLDRKPASWSFLQRLYQRAAWIGQKHPTGGGPGYVLRRTCLERVNGFESPESSADILLSSRLIEGGWKSAWWLEAPFFHYPVNSLKRLMKQRHHWGQTDAVMHRGSMKAGRRILLVFGFLGSPLLAIVLAIRFRNPFQLFLFSAAHYAWVVGYIGTWLRPGKLVANR